MTARRTALAGGMMVATRLATRLLDLAALLVLARLLSPADFGLVAIATSIVTVVESALELPLNQALLRVERIEGRHYDSAFTLGALRCLVLYALLVVALWPLSAWYGDPRLVALSLAAGLGAIARGLVSPRLAEYQRRLSFWRDVSVELTGKIAGAVLGIALACLTRYYWSVAIAGIASPTVTLVASYLLAPYRPRFSLADLPLFANFLGWLSLAQVISTMNWQSERLLLGRFVPVARLGLFTASSDLSQVPIQAVLSPVMRPLLAAFHTVRHDEARLARSYRMSARAVLMIGVPILVGESLVAEPIVRVVLGERWLGAAPLLAWLAPSLIPGLLVLPSLSLMTAFGETRDLVFRNGLEILTKLPLLGLGYLVFGLAGVALARFGSEAVAALVCMRVVRRMVGVPIRRQLADAVPALLAAALMVPAVLSARAGLAALVSPPPPGLELATSVTLGAAVYVAVLAGLWHANGRPDGLEAIAADALTALRLRLATRLGRAVESVRAG